MKFNKKKDISIAKHPPNQIITEKWLESSNSTDEVVDEFYIQKIHISVEY